MRGELPRMYPWKSLLAAGVLLLASYRSVSQTGAVPCLATGIETLRPELPHYQPGEIVHVSGTGYRASCAVSIRLTSADGKADGSTVTTDPAGGLAFSFLLAQESSQGQYKVETYLGADSLPQTAATFTNGAYIETDRLDYAPNNPVTIRGVGWMPGETVTIVLDELDGPDQGMTYTAATDSSGRFTNTDFMTDEHDLAVHFRATATGMSSVRVARTEFKDGL